MSLLYCQRGLYEVFAGTVGQIELQLLEVDIRIYIEICPLGRSFTVGYGWVPIPEEPYVRAITVPVCNQTWMVAQITKNRSQILLHLVRPSLFNPAVLAA